MKSTFLVAAIAALFFPGLVHAQKAKKTDIEISSAVLKTAEWAQFKYRETLEQAQKGDQKSIKELLEFSGMVDGTEALEHATTCIEIIPLAGDDKVGSVISSLKPKLKTVLLNRFVLAQVRTKHEELRKPIQEWAPLCWKALNGEMVVCGSCLHETGQLMSKPGAEKPNNPKMQSSEIPVETGKQ